MKNDNNGSPTSPDMCENNSLNFNLRNVIKYIGHSVSVDGHPLHELRKAKWYLEREILTLERNSIDWNTDRDQLRGLKDKHSF